MDVNYQQVKDALQGAISQYQKVVADLPPLSGNCPQQLQQTAVLNQNQGTIIGLQLAIAVLADFAGDDSSLDRVDKPSS